MEKFEERIAAWREEIGGAESIGNDALRELESHLRDTIDGELEGGATLQEAFDQAVIKVGNAAQLEPEYCKVCPDLSWAKRFIWMLSGFALISVILRAIRVVQQVVEGMFAHWFPGKTIALPWSLEFEGPTIWLPNEKMQVFDSVPISIIAGIFTMLLLTCLAIWFGARCIRGKVPSFDRWFAPCHAKPALAFILISCAFLIFITFPAFWSLIHWITFPDPGSVHALLAFYFGAWAGHAQIGLLIAFSMWSIGQLRKNRGRRFATWMFAGFFVVTGLTRIAGLIGGLIGAASLSLIPDFASKMAQSNFRLPIVFFYSNASVIALACLVLLCVGLAIVGSRIALSGRGARTERLLHRLWEHSLFLMILWHIPGAWRQVMTLTQLLSPSLSYASDEVLFEQITVLSISFNNALSLTPLLTIAFAVSAGWVLFREQPDSRRDADAVSA